jgi:hypothetical protein
MSGQVVMFLVDVTVEDRYVGVGQQQLHGLGPVARGPVPLGVKVEERAMGEAVDGGDGLGQGAQGIGVDRRSVETPVHVGNLHEEEVVSPGFLPRGQGWSGQGGGEDHPSQPRQPQKLAPIQTLHFPRSQLRFPIARLAINFP